MWSERAKHRDYQFKVTWKFLSIIISMLLNAYAKQELVQLYLIVMCMIPNIIDLYNFCNGYDIFDNEQAYQQHVQHSNVPFHTLKIFSNIIMFMWISTIIILISGLIISRIKIHSPLFYWSIITSYIWLLIGMGLKEIFVFILLKSKPTKDVN